MASASSTRDSRSENAHAAARRSHKRRHDQKEIRDGDGDKPDVEHLRHARAAYFSRPVEDRIKEARTAAKAERPKESRKRSVAADGRPKEAKSRHKDAAQRDKSKRTSRHRARPSSEELVYGTRQETSGTRTSESKTITATRLEHGDDAARLARRETRRKTRSVHTDSLEDERASLGSSKCKTTSGAPESGAKERPSVPRVSRTTSMRDAGPAQVRPSLKRSNTTSHAKAPTSQPLPDATAPPEDAATSPSKKDPRRHSSLLGSLFRHNSTPALPPRMVDCLTCGADDVPIIRSAKLACGHRMCHSCLKRIFTMSVTDPAHMPPKCCTSQHIPLKHVEHLFSLKFKVLWNKKYQEYTTKNRLYCPARGCGEWIKPSNIHSDQGRKYGKCTKCRTKVCALCNGKWHGRQQECPKDEETAKFVEVAKEEGWQKCYNCKAMVELKEGCNHMTCRCTAEFCMLCGAQWKTCDCPWFNYQPVPEGDRLQHMRIPEPINIIRRHIFGDPQQEQEGPAQPARRRPAPNPRDPARTYQEEVDARRAQERADEALARRLQLANFDDGSDAERAAAPRNGFQDIFGVGNAGPHHMNDDFRFVQNGLNVVMAAFEDAAFGRRGERSAGRRRRADNDRANEVMANAGLAPNAFGDESVLGVAPAQPPPARSGGPLREDRLRGVGREQGGDRIQGWLQRTGR
ncbi:hypothetical protein H2203_000811 [Taxawa tesnikishii (nom. ined.)]|nr:hypothetical protein H2203_000811 [Dothideales sp. JES 119]